MSRPSPEAGQLREAGTCPLAGSASATADAAAQPPALRGSERVRGWAEHPLGIFCLRLCTFVAILLIWQALATWLIGGFWISAPSTVAARIGKWAATGYLWQQVSITLEEAVVGFVLGALGGCVLGAVAGYYRMLGKVLEPIILALYSMPAIALAPLFLLWFGLGITSKIAVSGMTVLFIVFFNVYTGLRNVDQDLMNVVAVLGAKRRHIILKLILPSVLTYLFLGLKVSLPFALIGAVVAEMVSSTRGIGFMMQNSVNLYDTTGVFVGLVLVSGISVLLGSGLRRLEQSVLRWKDVE